jgi:hypothetical protein
MGHTRLTCRSRPEPSRTQSGSFRQWSAAIGRAAPANVESPGRSSGCAAGAAIRRSHAACVLLRGGKLPRVQLTITRRPRAPAPRGRSRARPGSEKPRGSWTGTRRRACLVRGGSVMREVPSDRGDGRKDVICDAFAAIRVLSREATRTRRIPAMLGKAEHPSRPSMARASRSVLAALIATVALAAPAMADTQVGGLLNGAGNTVGNQVKPVGEATATVVSQAASPSVVAPPSTPSVPVGAASPLSSAASPPSSSALPPTPSVVRAAASSPSPTPTPGPVAHRVNQTAGPSAPSAGPIPSATRGTLSRAKDTTTSVARRIPSAVPRTLSHVRRTTTSGTIIRQVTSTAGLLASSLPAPPVSPLSLESLIGLSPVGLPSLPVLSPPAASVGATPILLPSSYRPAGIGVRLARDGPPTLHPPMVGPVGTSVTPVSPWIALTSALTALSKWGLPPPRASSATFTGPTAASAMSVMVGSSIAVAAARSASGPAPINAPPAVPASGLSSAAGPPSGFSSIFLLLAGLLALGAPWARRLLRPSGRSRRPAPFVLIPERPG